MSVIDETWHWNASRSQIETQFPDSKEYRRVGLVGKTDRVIVETDGGIYPPHGSEIPLICQAPAMARLLLSLEWSGTSGGMEEATCCPACLARPDLGEAHNADCELVTVLRAAGVMP